MRPKTIRHAIVTTLVLALLAAPLAALSQVVPPMPGDTPSPTPSGGPPTVHERAGPPRIERLPASKNSQLTPQQRALRARKLAAMKQLAEKMRAEVKLAVLAKQAHWEQQQIAWRIQLWQAIAPRVHPEARTAISQIVYHLNNLNVQIGSLNRPIQFTPQQIEQQLSAAAANFGAPIAAAGGLGNGSGGCSAPQITSLYPKQGKPTDPVEVDGSGFGGGPEGEPGGQVYFILQSGDAVQATSTYWDSNMIVTTVPPSSSAALYSGEVYVDTCAQSNQEPFLYIPDIVVEPLPITANDVSWFDPKCSMNVPPSFAGNATELSCDTDMTSASQNAVSGTFVGGRGDDQFFKGFQLKNGWVVDSVNLRHAKSTSSDGNEIKTDNIGTSSPFVDVHWWVNAGLWGPYAEGYSLDIFIRGPAYLPYR